MQRVLLAAFVLSSSFAAAQVDAGAPVDAGLPVVAAPVSDAPAAATSTDDLRKEFEAKLEAARRETKELREEMRAQLATQSVASGWQEDWVDEKRKLELVTIDGYLRARPDLLYRFDMGRGNDQAGYSLFPRSPNSLNDRTQAGVNGRFRLEPTINVSEEIRIRSQIDMLDNLVWGSTPDYAYSRSYDNRYYSDRNEFSIFSMSQTTQRSGINSVQDSIAVKRVWGEVSTPVGILRFGRMPSHWGLGMLYNDGSGIDNDYGDTVDRVSFTAEPLPHFYITPMVDFNVTGRTSQRTLEGGQPYDLSLADNGNSYNIAIQWKDTDQERLAKLNTDQLVFNAGVHFSYRTQRYDDPATAAASLTQTSTTTGVNTPGSTPTEGTSQSTSNAGFLLRRAELFIPDVWLKLERKDFRIEAEAGAILGSMQGHSTTVNTTDANSQALYVYQVGGVLQGEYKLLNGDLEIGGEIGFASGDKAPGFGNYPRRSGSSASSPGATELGDTDGPQYKCVNGCTGPGNDNEITNFRFNKDYRVDMILYREILGGVTDSFYVKPKVKYRIVQGFEAFVAGIYSRAIFADSAPGALFKDADANLGIELNGGVRYETEDGFFGQVQYGILFPLAGFLKTNGGTGAAGDVGGAPITRDNPQAVRAVVGIRF